MDKFYCKAYFDLEYLKYLYKNKPKDILNYFEKNKDKIRNDDREAYLEYLKLQVPYMNFFAKKISKIYKENLPEHLFLKSTSTYAIRIYIDNLLLFYKFEKLNIKPTEKNIEKFLIDNSNIVLPLTIIRTGKYIEKLKGDYYASRKKEQDTIKSKDNGYASLFQDDGGFVLKNFMKILQNEEGYIIAIFIFLDKLIEKYGDKDIGVFAKIYEKGKEIMSKEYSDQDLIEVVEYHEKKRKEAEEEERRGYF